MDANKAVDANVDLFQPMVGLGRGRLVRLGRLAIWSLLPRLPPCTHPGGGREPDTAETNRVLSRVDGADHRTAVGAPDYKCSMTIFLARYVRSI